VFIFLEQRALCILGNLDAAPSSRLTLGYTQLGRTALAPAVRTVSKPRLISLPLIFKQVARLAKRPVVQTMLHNQVS
jgi:hypothetical protein